MISISIRQLLWIGAIFTVAGTQLTRAQTNVIWQIGVEGNGQAEFIQERSANDPPGSATDPDEDYYFKGTFPDTIGVVDQTEPC